jgi:hypothetical protein
MEDTNEPIVVPIGDHQMSGTNGMAATPMKKRGRPPGAKNKAKPVEAKALSAKQVRDHMKSVGAGEPKRRGRPPAAKKVDAAPAVAPKRRGRPPAAKQPVAAAAPDVKGTSVLESVIAAARTSSLPAPADLPIGYLLAVLEYAKQIQGKLSK